MDRRQLRESIQTVLFTTSTPFSAEGDEILLDAYESNVETLADRGASCFVPCGNTGEYYSLSDQERIAVVRATVDASGPTDVVLAGAGGSIEEVTSLVDRYDDVGADAAMVMHPSHTYTHSEGVITYYERLLEAATLPLVVYTRGPRVDERVLRSIAGHDNLVGVKFARDDIGTFAGCVSDSPDDVVWLNGIAERYAPAFALEGASGFTTGIGNFLPDAVLALDEAIAAEAWDRARRIRDALAPIETLRQESGEDNEAANANNVPVVKYGQDLAGLTGGAVRPPLVGLSERDRARLRSLYESVQSLEL